MKNLFEVSKILMQAFPEKFNRETVLQDLMKFEHVLDIHFIQGWSVDESSYSLSLHVKVPFEGEDCALR
ncbi:MAG: hypothetical protein LW878_14235 [Proteobacteria bacterium]|nr:hypothetical protein [Pseudomonadota bacterium]